MYKKALHEEFNPSSIKSWVDYKVSFKKEHPYYFAPSGTCIFCGAQGSGKTLSAVNYVYNLLNAFPYCILVTNISLRDYPFNAHLVKGSLSQALSLRDDLTHHLIDTDFIFNSNSRVCVEYSGLDCLKYISNGEFGVIYLIDELHLELNSLESKNIDIDVITEISQQRKQRKHIVGTSQIFMRLAKPVREQIADVVICRNLFGCIQLNKLIDGSSAVEVNGKLQATIKSRQWFIHDPDMYQRYDTFAKMKRLNQEWQGHRREPVNFFEKNIVKE